MHPWLNETYGDSAVQLRNYTGIRKDRMSGRGGGIVCFVRDSLSCCVIGELQIPSLLSVNSEFYVFLSQNFF